MKLVEQLSCIICRWNATFIEYTSTFTKKLADYGECWSVLDTGSAVQVSSFLWWCHINYL